jgi:hypothetical protein
MRLASVITIACTAPIPCGRGEPAVSRPTGVTAESRLELPRRIEPRDVAQERGIEVRALDDLGHRLGCGEPFVVDADYRDDLGDALDELLGASGRAGSRA